MLPIIIGFLAGLVAAGVTFTLMGGGVPALIGALIAAAFAYVAGSMLATPDRKIGGTVAELVPDGMKAADAIDTARTTLDRVNRLKTLIKDADVRRECDEFATGLHALIAYVERDPGAYTVLRHYDATYGAQVIRVLAGYRDVEASGAPGQTAKAKLSVVRALDDVERAAAGELDRAVADRTLTLDADASAIKQLTAMDGYKTPGHATETGERTS